MKKIILLLICILTINLVSAYNYNLTSQTFNITQNNSNILIVENLYFNNTLIVDNYECELYIYDNNKNILDIDFKSMYNNGYGNMIFSTNFDKSNYTIYQYCTLGEYLNSEYYYNNYDFEVN